jgi:prophage regulatory protein
MSKLVRINQLVEKLNVSKSSIYLWISQGKFPSPFKIGGNTTVWKLDHIENWINEKENH